jgi:DASS family divalent anion:Na+ symporter
MFLTSMVANPLIAEFARTTVNVEITWIGWARASFVPGVISFLLVPYLVFLMTRPEIRQTPEAAMMARAELAKMGPMSSAEKSVLGVFVLAFGMWMTGSWTQINNTVVAVIALCLMLILRAITWDDVLKEHAGWNALIWFGGLIGMTEGLSRLGLISWFSTHVSGLVQGWSWIPTLVLMALIYMYSHYFFASVTAHTTAFYVPLLTIAAAAGAPPYVAALVLAYLSSFTVILTPYSGGPSAVYFGGGYINVKQWWSVDFIISVVLVVIWLGIGAIWWKALGLF